MCLESKDYVQIRNALTILFKILPYFPVLQQLASVVEKRIEKVRDQAKCRHLGCYFVNKRNIILLLRYARTRRSKGRTSTS